MIKWILLIVTSLVATGLHAQFLNLQINIEPELTATVEREMGFGEVITNSGTSQIRLGDLNMGVFSIRSLANNTIDIELINPDVLQHTDERITDVIPIELNMAYSYTQNYDQSDTYILRDNRESLSIAENADVSMSNWNTLYVYIYGAITVGDIPNGVYEGESILQVTYY